MEVHCLLKWSIFVGSRKSESHKDQFKTYPILQETRRQVETCHLSYIFFTPTLTPANCSSGKAVQWNIKPKIQTYQRPAIGPSSVKPIPVNTSEKRQQKKFMFFPIYVKIHQITYGLGFVVFNIRLPFSKNLWIIGMKQKKNFKMQNNAILWAHT